MTKKKGLEEPTAPFTCTCDCGCHTRHFKLGVCVLCRNDNHWTSLDAYLAKIGEREEKSS